MANRPKTGGRVAGTPNKATSELKDLARLHGPALFNELVRLALGAESEAARVSAIKEAFDRGWGRPAQGVDVQHTGANGGPIEFTFSLDHAEPADDFE